MAISARPSRVTEIRRERFGRFSSRTYLPAAGDPEPIANSTISRFSRFRSIRVTSSCCGSWCSIKARIVAVAETVSVIPTMSKCGWLRGSLTRAITFGTPYFSLATWQTMMLSSSSPVTAITRSARSTPARSSTNSSVASPNRMTCSNFSSSSEYRSRSLSTSVTSWPTCNSATARFEPTLPPPAISTYMRSHPPRGGADRLGHDVDRPRRRAHRLQPLGQVERRPGRVEHPADNAGAAEPGLRDLGDHDVGVVPVGRDHGGVGLGDPGLDQHVDVEPVADDERARPVVGQPLKGLGVLVDNRHLVAVLGHLCGDPRAHPAAADDQQFHGAEAYRVRGPVATSWPGALPYRPCHVPALLDHRRPARLRHRRLGRPPAAVGERAGDRAGHRQRRPRRRGARPRPRAAPGRAGRAADNRLREAARRP